MQFPISQPFGATCPWNVLATQVSQSGEKKRRFKSLIKKKTRTPDSMNIGFGDRYVILGFKAALVQIKLSKKK